jgi:ribosome biogenesis GTPase
MYENGRILRISGGLCWVLPDGDEETLPCVARGNVKRREEGVAVGDYVRISREGDAGVVEEVLPRRTYLIRPNVSNVDQAIVVVAATQPDPNPYFLDRFLVLVEHSRLDAVICINKVDLVEPESLRWLLELYSRIGYTTISTSARTGKGIQTLSAVLAGKTSVFAGPSGVGKSALLNMVQPGHDLAEGELSERIGRGRHTTREVRLIPLGAGGLVADTPGFSSLDITGIGLIVRKVEYALFQSRLAYAYSSDYPRDDGFTSPAPRQVGAKIRLDMGFHKVDHLAGHPGEADHSLVPCFKCESGRCAHSVGKIGARTVPGNQRLLRVVLSHARSPRCEIPFYVRKNLGVLNKPNPEDLCDSFPGQVIFSRP